MFEDLAKSCFVDSRFSDFKVLCRDRTFYVHRVVLSDDSKYFRAILNGDWKETHTQELELHEDDPSLVEAILMHIYGVRFGAILTKLVFASITEYEATSEVSLRKSEIYPMPSPKWKPTRREILKIAADPEFECPDPREYRIYSKHIIQEALRNKADEVYSCQVAVVEKAVQLYTIADKYNLLRLKSSALVIIISQGVVRWNGSDKALAVVRSAITNLLPSDNLIAGIFARSVAWILMNLHDRRVSSDLWVGDPPVQRLLQDFPDFQDQVLQQVREDRGVMQTDGAFYCPQCWPPLFEDSSIKKTKRRTQLPLSETQLACEACGEELGTYGQRRANRIEQWLSERKISEAPKYLK